MKDLNKAELQQVMLMTGSKKAFATYIGVETAEAVALIKAHSLQSPMEYMRGLTDQEMWDAIASFGDLDKGAEYFGVSLASLREELKERRRVILQVQASKEALVLALNRYKSIRLTARILGTTEGAIRDVMKKLEIKPDMLDISFSGVSAGKGRRAEIDFAALRGPGILEDMNRTVGPGALFDFKDSVLGRVNVKSSRRHSFTSWSKRADPNYWKVSTKGKDEADHFALMLYDEKMTNLIQCVVMPVRQVSSKASMVLTREVIKDLMEVNVFRL